VGGDADEHDAQSVAEGDAGVFCGYADDGGLAAGPRGGAGRSLGASGGLHAGYDAIKQVVRVAWVAWANLFARWTFYS